MAKFWSYISNGTYSVGCTGGSVYVYDKNGAELAKFKDMPYAYWPSFSPKGDIFVVKSTAGRLAVYSLDSQSLIKKFRFSKVDNSQDDNFCFSPDGEKLYNIERHIDGCKTALSVYHTSDFSLEKRLFADDFHTVLSFIEYDKGTDTYYLLGYFRNYGNDYFVAKLRSDTLCDIVYLPERDYDCCVRYKKIEGYGFTDLLIEWTLPDDYEQDFLRLKSRNYSLAMLWRDHEKNRNPV